MSASKVKKGSLIYLFILITGLGGAAYAQTQTTGAIQGLVYELGTKAPIPKASVRVVKEGNGLVRTAMTNAEGVYFIGMLPPGFYTVSATCEGYENDPQSITGGFPIRLSRTNLVQPPPITLRKTGPAPPPAPAPALASGATTNDSAAERLVNTLNAARGGNFDLRQLNALPLLGVRTFESLAFLLPGVAPPPQPLGSAVGPGIGAGIGTAGQFSVNGSRSRCHGSRSHKQLHHRRLRQQRRGHRRAAAGLCFADPAEHRERAGVSDVHEPVGRRERA